MSVRIAAPRAGGASPARILVLLAALALAACGGAADGPRPPIDARRTAADAGAGTAADAADAPAGVVRYDSAGRRWTRLESEILTRGRTRDRAVVLVRERRRETCCLDGERESVTASDLTAWTDTAADARPAWRATLTADETTVRDGWVVSVLHGCCDSADLYEFRDLATGALAFRASQYLEPPDSILPGLEAPNARFERFVAFHDLTTPVPPAEAAGRPEVVGVLQYGPRAGAVQRVLVLGTDSIARASRLATVATVVHDTASSASHRDLWSADRARSAAAMTGFRVRVTLFSVYAEGRPLVVEIPVVNDRLDVARATRPANLRLEAVR